VGTYVEFWACPPEGPLAQIAASAGDFAAWYVGDFAEDGDPRVLGLIRAMVEHGPAALAGLAPEFDAVVDQLVGEFYGFYCDHSGGLRLRGVNTSMLRVWRYRLLHAEMGGGLAPAVSELWGYIDMGRPVAPPGRVRGYVSDDDASWVAWWSLAEVELLQGGLPGRGWVGSEETEGVLDAVHDALEFAARERCGLVVTAF